MSLQLNPNNLKQFMEIAQDQDSEEIKEQIQTIGSVPIALIKEPLENAIDCGDEAKARVLLLCLSVSSYQKNEARYVNTILRQSVKNGLNALAQWMVKNDDLPLKNEFSLYKRAINNGHVELAQFFLDSCNINAFKAAKKALDNGYDALAQKGFEKYDWRTVSSFGWRDSRKFKSIVCKYNLDWVKKVEKIAFSNIELSPEEYYSNKAAVNRLPFTDMTDKKRKYILDKIKGNNSALTDCLVCMVKSSENEDRAKIIKELLARGANPDGDTENPSEGRNFHSTPVYHAAKNGKVQYLTILMQYDPSYNTNSKAFARNVIQFNNYDLVEKLVDVGFKLDSNAFYSACCADNKIFHIIYQQYEPRVDVAHNAIEHIIENGDPDKHIQNLLDLLSKINFDPDRLDQPMKTAVQSGEADWVRTLLGMGCEIDSDDELLIALNEKDDSMISFLLAHGAKVTGAVQEKAQALDEERSAYQDDKWQPLLVEEAPPTQSALLRV